MCRVAKAINTAANHPEVLFFDTQCVSTSSDYIQKNGYTLTVAYWNPDRLMAPALTRGT